MSDVPGRVYLDWNATTPPLPAVLDAMRAAAEATWGNPASVHADGRAARRTVEDARGAVALLAGADPRDVVFTSGGTEANNIALRSAFTPTPCDPDAGAPSGDGPPWLVTSRLEHPSVTRVAEALEAEGRARVRWLRVTPEGTVDLDDLDAALAGVADGDARGRVALVTVQAVNHETGVLQPVAEVTARARAASARVHVDAVQAWGKIDTGALRAASSVSLAGHKIRGPKGIGALVTRPGLPLAPVLRGGAQERGLRPGTVDPAMAAGLGVAAARALDTVMQYAQIAAMRDRLEAALLALPASPRPTSTGETSRRAPHVSTLVWPGWAGPELVAALDLEGISVSSGSACSAGTSEPSPVLEAMLGREAALSGLRVSLGETTTEPDVDRAIAAFTRVTSR